MAEVRALEEEKQKLLYYQGQQEAALQLAPQIPISSTSFGSLAKLQKRYRKAVVSVGEFDPFVESTKGQAFCEGLLKIPDTSTKACSELVSELKLLQNANKLVKQKKRERLSSSL